MVVGVVLGCYALKNSLTGENPAQGVGGLGACTNERHMYHCFSEDCFKNAGVANVQLPSK